MTHSKDRAARVAAIERANRVLLSSMERLHAEDLLGIGVSMSQVKALHLLGTGEGLHLWQLAAALGVTLSTASASVERLVETGLASRTDDPVDRRQVVIRRTQAGDEVLDRLHAMSHPLLSRLLAALDDAELDIVEQSSAILARAAERLVSGGLPSAGDSGGEAARTSVSVPVATDGHTA